jgi:hypothetical protein
LETPQEKKHSKYSASASARWFACPGSIKRSADCPPQKSSAAADEGTTAHELMEFALNSNVKNVVKFFENDEEKYPLEMREHVQGFVNYVRSEIKPGFELYVEEKSECEFIHPEMGGTADVVIIEPFGMLHIIDFKYGSGYVDHVENTQMIQYALGVAYKHKFDFDTVKTTIYQPRGGKDVVRSWQMPISELENKWLSLFTNAVSACETADSEKDLTPGDHCKYCPAKIKCPAITTKTLAKVKLDFSAPVLPQGKELSKEQLKTILDKAEYLELWIDEVKRYAESVLKDGGKILGWELAPTRPQRVWQDPAFIKDNYPELTVTELMSPAQAEKVLKKKDFDTKTFLKDNVAHVSSGVKLSKTEIDY